MRSLRAVGRLPLASLLLFLPALTPAAWLELDRSAVARGEVWRLITGHWAHWTPDHLLWDSLVFLVLAVLCETRISRGRLVATVLGSALAVSAAVWLALPDIVKYRGLSGVDSALFVLVAASLRSPLGGLALAAFLGKSAWEVWTGATLFTATGSFVPVPLAHLVGGVFGLVVGIAGRPPTSMAKASVGRPAAPSAVSPERSGNSPAVSGPGAGLWGRLRSGRCRNS